MNENTKMIDNNLDGSSSRYRLSNNNRDFLIIQINDNNKQKKDIIKLKKQYKINEEKFCCDAIEFYSKLKNICNISIKYLNNESMLKSHLKYLSSSLSSSSYDDNIYKIVKKCIIKNTFEKLHIFTNYGKIRMKISKLLNNIVPPQNIQLYRSERYSNSKLFIAPWDSIINTKIDDKLLYFDIVSYDVIQDNNNNNNNEKYFDDIDEKKEEETPKDIIKSIINLKININENIINDVTFYIKIVSPKQFMIPTKTNGQIKKTITMKYASKFELNKKCNFVKNVMDEISKPIGFKTVVKQYTVMFC